MKLIIPFSLLLLLLVSCNKNTNNLIFKNKQFEIYSDHVTQGKFEAKAISAHHLVSNYQSPANNNFSNWIEFKFAINGKDNELPIGVNHTYNLRPDKNGKIVLQTLKFGIKESHESMHSENESLPSNTAIHIEVDCRDVISKLNAVGFYKTSSGTIISKSDFKGIFIAGNLAPLSWDFDNLASREKFKLTDQNNDGIFEIDLQLNPFNAADFTSKEWKLKNDISNYPQLKSPSLLVDALYNLSLDETRMNIENDETFRTGESWPGVWTRDVSYSIILAYAIIEPEIAKASLMRKVKNGRIIQDTGTGGAWPVSTDRMIWAVAAWEIFKVTGDHSWLKKTYDIIAASAFDDLKTVYDSSSGLFRGESSFLDWRQQTYPRWMNGVDIANSYCIGTNAVHYMTYRILAQMSTLLNDRENGWFKIAEKTKDGINKYFWNNDVKYYGQYRYGRTYQSLSTRSETLGEALSILFDIAGSRSTSIIDNLPQLEFGVPCIYPQIPGIPPYHNNAVWPFVQAYLNLAAAKTNSYKSLEQGLASIFRASALFLTNKENMVAFNGDYRDTQVNSNRQLWSIAGNLAMTYHVFFGMEFTPSGILFNPVIPEAWKGNYELKNFKYRNSILDITVKGYGNEITLCKLDGKLSPSYFDNKIIGRHTIEIELSNSISEKGSVNIAPSVFSPETPIVQQVNNTLVWNAVKGASKYNVIYNGEIIAATSVCQFQIEKNESFISEYQIEGVGANGTLSFLSEPITVLRTEVIYEAENEATPCAKKLIGFTGNGCVEMMKSQKHPLVFPLEIFETGDYLIDFRYSNGNGPDNTDNKCAIRTLAVDVDDFGVIIMPQRGANEWSNWGYSNSLKVNFEVGDHQLSLKFNPYNENMSGDENRVIIDHLRIRRFQ